MATNKLDKENNVEDQTENEADEDHSLLFVEKTEEGEEEIMELEQQNVVDTEQDTEVVIEQETTASQAIDGGYGWLVVLGSVILHMLIGGLERSSGVLFLIFREKYHESAAATAWVLSLASAIRLMAGPLASALCQKFSHRIVVIAGGIVCSFGILLCAFAPNLLFLFFTYGVLRGLWLLKTIPYLKEPVTAHSELRKRKLNKLKSSDAERCLKNKTINDDDGDDDEEAVSRNSKKANNISRTPNGIERKQSKVSLLRYVMNRRKSSVAKPKVKIEKKKEKILEIKLLKDFRFFSYCVAMFLFTIAFQAAFVFLPSYGKQIGLSDIEAAYVLSVAGVLDTIGRIGSGAILELKWIKPYRMFAYNSIMFFLVVTCILIPFTRSFLQLAIVAAGYGMLSGSYVSQKSVIIVDLLGPEKLNNSFGLLICFQGVGMLIGPPIAGMFKDSFGQVDEAFYFGGCSIMLGAVLLTFSNVVHYLREKRKASA